ncbi:MAG: insulinase family protein [Magnetococcales bacterium]|nr:insulinase family protein [Magnetococcales bacterium]
MTRASHQALTAWIPPRLALVRRLGLAVLCLAPLSAYGLEHQDFTLENGLRVILVREPKAPVVLSEVWYRVGSVDEVEGKTGLSHMLEHMMFQGTPKVPSGEFHRLVGRNGGEDNASTSYDFTCYYIKLASDRAELALRLEADRMRHLSLRDEEFHPENQVVQEERRMRTDADPTGRFLEKFLAKAYGTHPYGRPVIGWMTDIQHFTTDDLRTWYQRYYVPNNAVLVLVGDLELEPMAQQVRRHFADIPAAPPVVPTVLPAYQPPALAVAPIGSAEPGPTEAQRLEIADKAVTLPVWYSGYPVPTLLTEGREDVFALDVLATILGGGSSSRLYQKLVMERGLAVSVAAHYGGYGRSWELLTVSASPPSTDNEDALAPPVDGHGGPPVAPPERSGASAGVTGVEALPLIEQIVQQEVLRLTQEPVSERELQRAKNGMIAQHVFGRDSIHELASEIGLLSLNGLDWVALVEGYPQKIAEVRAEDVQRVAARYLRPEQRIVGVLKP